MNQIKDSFDRLNPDQDERNEIFEKICLEASQTSEKITNMQRRSIKRTLNTVLVCILVLTGSSGGVYAAMQWLSASQVAQETGDQKLAEEFGKHEYDIITEISGDYRIVYLGVVSGDNISSNLLEEDIYKDKTYVAVAIERTDGIPITNESDEIHNIIVSPFLQGEKPWQFNIFSMHGGATGIARNGIFYRIIEVDSLQIFANREVYLGVYQNGISYPDLYNYDEATGDITRNSESTDLNCLFDIKLDPKKADDEAAIEYLKNAYAEQEGTDTSYVDDNNESDTKVEQSSDINSLLANMKMEDQNITFDIWDCSSVASNQSSNEDSLHGYYNLYTQIDGTDIDYITFSLNQGEFLKKTEAGEGEQTNNLVDDSVELIHSKDCIVGTWGSEHSNKDCEYIGDKTKTGWIYTKAGSSYTVDYSKQNTNENVYAIAVTTDLPEYSSDDIEIQHKEDLQKISDFLKDTVVTVTVHKKNGDILEHKIVFYNTDISVRSKAVIAQWENTKISQFN